jgi:hypothetical protein
MSTTKGKRRMNRSRTEPNLDDFVDAFRDSRPFAAVRVNEPSPKDVDVESIHAAAFEKLKARAGEALKLKRGVGVMLMGQAGVGKSHLLSRLSRWGSEPVAKGRVRACYVFLHNLLADPERLPRYLLKYVVNVQARGRSGPLNQTPLYRLIEYSVLHAVIEAKENPSEITFKRALGLFGALMDREGVDTEVWNALFGFYRHNHPGQKPHTRRGDLAEAALAWLSGEEINADAARDLSLDARGKESAELRDDQQIEQVFMALCRQAMIREQPFVLCIDQVDNLDADKLAALSRFLHALIDHAPNLLVITSGVKGTLEKFAEDGVISHAAWDRLAEFKIQLDRVKAADARHIVEARLERFLEPFRQLEPVHRHAREDVVFPLGREWLAKQLADGVEFRPRDVLMWARDAWEDQQAAMERLGAAEWFERWPRLDIPPPSSQPIDLEARIDEKVDRKIEEQIEGHRLQAGGLPPDAGNLAGLVLALLEQCRGRGELYTFRSVERMAKKGGKLPPYDLLVHERREGDGREVKTGIVFITSSGLSASVALGRLLNCDPPPDHRLLVTDHERRPLKVGPQGEAYYKDLTKLGPNTFQHIKLDFEQYARLDALVGIVSQGRVGDLEIEAGRGVPRAVTEEEVIASHHRQDRYRAHPLLRPLLTEEPPEGTVEVPVIKPAVDEADARQFIMGQLAWQMGTTLHALAKAYIKSTPALGLGLDQTRAEFRKVVERLHAEGLVYATPQEDDLFVQYLGK